MNDPRCPIRIDLRRLSVALILVLALVVPLASPLHAITKIADVRVAADDAGTDASDFFFAPSGTEDVYVLFDYTGASRNGRVIVAVKGPNGIELFRQEERYSGDGTAAVRVSGDELLGAAAQGLDDAAGEIVAAISQVTADSASETQLLMLLDSLKSVIGRAQYIVPLLEGMDQDSLREPLGFAGRALDELEAGIDDARAIPVEDVADRQAVVADLEAAASDLQDLADQIEADVSSQGNLVLPLMGEQWQFDVSVSVNEGGRSSPAGDAVFVVADMDRTQTSGEDATPRATQATSGGNRREGMPPRPTQTAPPASRGAATATSDRGDTGTDDDGDEGRQDAAAGRGNTSIAAAARRTAAARSASRGDDESEMSTEAAGRDGATGRSDDEEALDAALDTSDEDTQEDAANRNRRDEGQAETGGDADAGAGDAASSEGDAAALPTWTPEAFGGPDADVPVAGGDEDGGSGPNLLILALGGLVLVGVAFWFRRRL